MNYDETKKFTRDFKKLLRKFPSLRDDLKITKKYRIELFHCKKIDNRNIFQINGVGNYDELRFYKIKKFQCKSLKGRGAKSSIRVVYAFFPIQQKVVFLEIYFKAKQENEDRRRVMDFIKGRMSL